MLQGCHEFSSELYQSLRTRVASEHFYFWLNALMEFSQAEHCLTGLTDRDYSGAISAITDALQSYQKGFTSLTVSVDQFTHISDKHPELKPSIRLFTYRVYSELCNQRTNFKIAVLLNL